MIKRHLGTIIKVLLWVFFGIGVAMVSWIMVTSGPQEYMATEIRQIVTGFVVKGALAFIGFFGIKAAFLHLITTLRKHDFEFVDEMPRAIFYSAIFFALSFFLAFILI